MNHQLLKNHPGIVAIARSFTGRIVLATALLAAAALLTLAVPLFLESVVAHYQEGRPVFIPALLVTGLIVGALFLHAYGGLRATMVTEQLKSGLRQYLYDYLLRRDLAFHRNHGPGDLLSAMYTDADQLSNYFAQIRPSAFARGIMLIGAFIALASIDPVLAAVVISGAVLVLMVLQLTLRKIRQMGKTLHKRIGENYQSTSQSFQQLLVIKAYRLRDRVRQQFQTELDAIVGLNVRLRFYYGLLAIAAQFLLLVLLISGWLLLSPQQADTSTGEQISVVLYGLILVRQLGALTNLAAQYRQSQGALDRLDLLMDRPPAEAVVNGVPLEPLQTLQVADLCFAYQDTPVLNSVTFSVAAGDRIALTGPNGSGKTTLLNIIAGLEPAPDGDILWNSEDLDQTTLDQRLRKIAYMPQTSLLGQATIADNIRMGRPQASEDDIWAAAERAGAAEQIRNLAQGMDTVLGTAGSKLSGGEQRRLALARLLLRTDADLFLLDEPTEGLDTESEKHFLQTALNSLEGKTVIVVTHRASVADHMDQEWRMEAGCLAPVRS